MALYVRFRSASTCAEVHGGRRRRVFVRLTRKHQCGGLIVGLEWRGKPLFYQNDDEIFSILYNRG